MIESLVAAWWPLVAEEARRASRRDRRVPPEEFESAAALGLLRAASRFDTSLGVPFEAYARLRIRGAMADARREWLPMSHARRGRVVSLVPIEDAVAARLGVDASQEDVTIALDRAATLDVVISLHPNARARRVLRMIAAGVGFREASRAVGRSDTYGSQAVKDVRRRVRAANRG